jgi:hypothetical protein
MRSLGARFTKILVLAALALAVTASSASAASSVHMRIRGVVPHIGGPAASLLGGLPNALGLAAPTTLTVDTHYETLINRYLTDVAHDSGGIQNVYAVATQYTDGAGAIQYKSTFGGAYVAHDPLPTSGCDDGSDSYCLTDAQLQAEIQNAMTAKGWTGGLTHMFFLLTPSGVGSCEFSGAVSNSNPCSTNFFCAYHNNFVVAGNVQVIYANEPYEGPTVGCTAEGFPGLRDQGFPNDVDSDTTINTISHEHNEAITDPLGNGWVAADNNENGDLCAYIFGTELGGTPGTNAWNQVINGHHYDLQEEYSNADTGCIQRPGDTPLSANVNEQLPYNGGPVMHTNTTYAIYWLPTSGNTSAPVVTGTAHVNQTLTTTAGSWNDAPVSFAYAWQRCSSAGTGCANIPGATAKTYKLTSADGGHTVRSSVRVTNVNGPSAIAASGLTALVIDVPAATTAPHVSGHAHVGKKLTGSHGSWTYSPTSYRFQWLRCNAHGGSCASIHHATHSTYKLTSHDAKHRLRFRVTATNAVGSTVATSAATARVRH